MQAKQQEIRSLHFLDAIRSREKDLSKLRPGSRKPHHAEKVQSTPTLAEACVPLLSNPMSNSNLRKHQAQQDAPNTAESRGLWDRKTQEQMLGNLLRPSLGIAGGRVVARALIDRFSSLPHVLAAPLDQIVETPGVGPRTAAQLSLCFNLAKLIAKENLADDRPILSSWSELLEYIRVKMAFEPKEHCRVLFLDKKNRLILDEVVSQGIVDYVAFYPREVIYRALQVSASAMIIVHNHPSGDVSPSSQDIRMTRELEKACLAVGLVLHDHLIVGQGGHASLRGLKLL